VSNGTIDAAELDLADVVDAELLNYPAPKDPLKNIEYRQRIITLAENDEEFQEEVKERCQRDVVWYFDTFLWTYSPKDYPDCPHRPFITYPFQEDAIRRLDAAIGNHDVLIEKTRDMGASWITLGVIARRFHFFYDQSFLVGSRKEEYVDKSGDPKTLFWKIDYIFENLPGWMCPRIFRNNLHIHNEDTGSTIDGESTNDEFATGDRRTAVFLDEFSKVKNGNSILTATRDVTHCRIFNGTPKGVRNAYYKKKRQMELRNPENVIRMHWSIHPEKNPGLYTTNEKGEIEILDKSYVFPPNYNFILTPTKIGAVRSPWYDNECSREPNEMAIAQELDIDYVATAGNAFDPPTIEALIKRHCRPFDLQGEIDAFGDITQPNFEATRTGRLKLWIKPDFHGNWHFEQEEFIIGCDIATGKGGKMSSNSVASILNKRTGVKVGQFTSNKIDPGDFALYAIGLCHFFRGVEGRPAFLIWEENGPGGGFTKVIIEQKFTNVFYREDETLFLRKKSRDPGWNSNKKTKRLLLESYRRDLKDQKFINPYEESMRECLQYEEDPNGDIYHRKSKDEDASEAGEMHGDMVIADALANRGRVDVPLPKPENEATPRPGSFFERRQARLQKRTAQRYW
jgi:hypothetical protein